MFKIVFVIFSFKKISNNFYQVSLFLMSFLKRKVRLVPNMYDKEEDSFEIKQEEFSKIKQEEGIHIKQEYFLQVKYEDFSEIKQECTSLLDRSGLSTDFYTCSQGNTPQSTSEICNLKTFLDNDKEVFSNLTQSIFTSETEIFNHGKGEKIVRNYAKALVSFASCTMAVPYLTAIIHKEENCGNKLDVKLFQRYIKTKKQKTVNISRLRALLLVQARDSDTTKMYKHLFSEISVVFIKYFAVNWIFSGRVKYREDHLKYRLKMLRRIRNPEYFTYLRNGR